MINDWKKYLGENGFDKMDRRTFGLLTKPISTLIYETPLRVGSNRVRLNAALEIHDPWESDRDYHTMDLRGDVTQRGIYVHYDESPEWLDPAEADLIFDVFKHCLMSWINYWSEPARLIDYFENPVDHVLTRISPADGGCEHVGGVPVKLRLSPQRDYLLSLLYYHARNFREALAAAERYAEFMEGLTSYEGEPDRTRRQIAELLAELEKR